MKEIFFAEMKKSIDGIRSLYPKDIGPDNVHPLTDMDQMLFHTLAVLIDCGNVARSKGLLSLEEEYCLSDLLDGFSGAKYLKYMITLIVDGTNPDYIRKFCYYRLCSSNLEDYGKLQYLIMLEGILCIQAGDNPRIIEETLKYMLPEELLDEYEKWDITNPYKKQADKGGDGCLADTDRDILNKVCVGEIAVEPTDDYYYVIKMTDKLLLSFNNEAMQRFLRDVDNVDLSMMMMAISGQARRKIFDNLSNRLAVMIATDMIFRGAIKLEEAGKATRTIFHTIVRLIASREIAFSEDALLEEMATIFLNMDDESPTPESIREARVAESRLYGLWDEYLSHSHKLIDLPYKNKNP